MGQMIGIRQRTGTIQTYVAMPQKAMHFRGAVIVAHELWGLTEQIKSVADRFADQGYYALAPDLYSTDKVNRRPSPELEKQLFSKDEKVRYHALPQLRAMIAPTQTPQFTLFALSKLESCFEYAYNQPLVHQKVAVVGFGLGGTYAFELALQEPRLMATVSFYGSAPRLAAELRHIKSPVMAFYGGKETALKKELAELVPRMRQANVEFHSVMYNNDGHGFFNDQNPLSFNQKAHDDSWNRTLTFLREYVDARRMY